MFQHAEFAYLALLGVASVYCFRANTQDSLRCLFLLWFLYGTAQIPTLWEDPRQMASVHAGAFFIVLGALYNGISIKMQILTTLMLACDVMWVIFSYIEFPTNALEFPSHLFWWHTVINVLFMIMCLTLIVGCRNTIEGRRVVEGKANSSVLFRVLSNSERL